MTNLEKATRSMLLQFMIDNIGATELNPLKQIKDLGEALEVELEDGSKKIVSIIVTDSDE